MTELLGSGDTLLQEAFRSAMGSVASAVAVVTTLSDGEPYGTTVSAFASLSMRPPMVLVSLGADSNLLARLVVGSMVGVNVLAADQDEVAVRFARRGGDKFAGVGWRIEDGAPALAAKHAWACVSVSRLVEAGDHTIVIGAVRVAEAYPGRPLTYWRSTFGTHASAVI
ncbi:flavin reductase family protein [Dactylosporangium sp. CA-233914]|uniref:flavin reductase family protein n=1 Tax=Dactylosporangium sp. CA-233914 TaxID=3239934 RepID=UPI003D8D5305